MTDEKETVELDESAADAIAQKTADKVGDSAIAKMAAEFAELKAMLLSPKRTNLGDTDGEPARKSGEAAPIYGGDDLYTMTGEDDADIATNLWLTGQILKGNDRNGPVPAQLSERATHVMRAAGERALKSAPKAIPETTERNGQKVLTDPGHFVLKSTAAYRAEAYAKLKALTAAGVGSGADWVPTFATSELWRDFHLASTVVPQFRRVDMPTNPYTLPTETADVTFRYVSTENVAVTASNPTTSSATLTARKIQGEVDFSGEVTEDSIIPIIPNLRFDLVRRGGQTMDDLVVNGDTTTAASGNVQNDDGAPAAGSYFLAFAGLRKFWNVTNTGQETNMAAAPTTVLLNAVRKLLGRYGARPSDLILLTGPATYYALQTIAEVITLEKYGPNATVLTGELARWFNIPILLNESTDKVQTSGRLAVVTPTNNTTGWLGLVNTTMWKTGFRRDLQIESFRDIQKDQNILVASFRMAFIPSGISTQISAGSRNITV
jgi:HK97 family phage major capsid protein